MGAPSDSITESVAPIITKSSSSLKCRGGKRGSLAFPFVSDSHWSTPSRGATVRLQVAQGLPDASKSRPAAPATNVGSQSVTCIISCEIVPLTDFERPAPYTHERPRTPPSHAVALLPRSGKLLPPSPAFPPLSADMMTRVSSFVIMRHRNCARQHKFHGRVRASREHWWGAPTPAVRRVGAPPISVLALTKIHLNTCDES